MAWADLVLRNNQDILDSLDRDVILYDWEYSSPDPAVPQRYARLALDKGFRVIGGPALTYCRWGPRIGREQLRNIDAFCTAYQGLDDERALGVIVTDWVPGRFLVDSGWDGQAYAAVCMAEGPIVAWEKSPRRFVERHWGAHWNEEWEDAFRTLYDLVPNREHCSPPWLRPALPVPWVRDEDLAQTLAEGRTRIPPFRRLLERLAELRPQVTRHVEQFDALVLTVEYLHHVHWRQAKMVRVTSMAEKDDPGGGLAAAILSGIADADAKMRDRILAEHRRSRPTTPWEKGEWSTGVAIPDRLVSRLVEAADYSAALAEQPGRLAAIARAPKERDR